MSAANSTLPVGYSMLEPGRIATVVTYLEMKARPASREHSSSSLDLALESIGGSDLGAYRALFRRVGEPWLWWSRLVMPDAQLCDILKHPKVDIRRLCRGREAIGLLELDFRNEGECELAYFGLVSDVIGRGAGRQLMELAIDIAWAQPIRRFFVHTCGLDHPRALEFYRRSGFRPYRLAVEVFEDPRLSGHLPRGAAPHIPVIEAATIEAS